MTNREKYESGKLSFVQSPTDNPECIPFYRAWAGMRAVAGDDRMKEWHHSFHRALLWNNEGQEWDRTIANLLDGISSGKRREVSYRSFYESEPDPDIDARALQIFHIQYRERFKGKRINGTHARDQWELVKGKAIAIARDEYQSLINSYNERKGKIDMANEESQISVINADRADAEFEYWIREVACRG